MKDLINLYIKDHELSWAPTTLKSEKHRLYSVSEQLTTSAIQLWEHLVYTQKPYSRVTTWTRIVHFYQWLLDNGHMTGVNEYGKFRRKNARLFKNAYQLYKPTATFEEAAKLIQTIPDENYRNQASQILGSGERYSESIQLEETKVIGKGNKRRRTYRPKGINKYDVTSYSSFRRALKKIGLKPHDLRKLCATKLVEKGMNEADLMEVMGWSSIMTAKAYLQPKKEQKLRDIFKLVHEELK